MFVFFISYFQKEFIFALESEKIILKIDNGKKYLEWNKTSTLNLKTENINIKTLTIITPGITFKKGVARKNELNLEIKPNRKLFGKGTVKFQFAYKSHDETCIPVLFVIPIK
jgi:hypothetical protein